MRRSAWSSGVEATGAVVTLLPLDADGNLVPVDGTLDVDLVGAAVHGCDGRQRIPANRAVDGRRACERFLLRRAPSIGSHFRLFIPTFNSISIRRRWFMPG